MPQLAAAVEAGPADGGGHPDRAVVAGALVLVVAGLEVAAVIRGEHHDGVVQQFQALERVEEPAEGLVEALDHAVVAAQVLLRGAAQGGQVGRGVAAGVALPVAIRRRVVVEVVLVVRLQEGEEQEERLLAWLGEVADGGVGLGVDPVAGEPHRLLVVVEQHHVVAVGDELEQVGREPAVVAAACRLGHCAVKPAVGQVPLADVGGVVAGALEVMGQVGSPGGSGMPLRKQPVVVAYLPVCRHERAGPHTGWGVKACCRWVPARAQPVEVRRQLERVAVHPGGVPALLVGEEDDDIRRFAHPVPLGVLVWWGRTRVRCCRSGSWCRSQRVAPRTSW